MWLECLQRNITTSQQVVCRKTAQLHRCWNIVYMEALMKDDTWTIISSILVGLRDDRVNITRRTPLIVCIGKVRGNTPNINKLALHQRILNWFLCYSTSPVSQLQLLILCHLFKAKRAPTVLLIFIFWQYGSDPWWMWCESIIYFSSMIYHKLLLQNNCVPTYCYDGYSILLLYVGVVYCHVCKSY